MIKSGLLDKYGKPNDQTPQEWLTNYVDYSLVKKEPADVTAATMYVTPPSESSQDRKVGGGDGEQRGLSRPKEVAGGSYLGGEAGGWVHSVPVVKGRQVL